MSLRFRGARVYLIGRRGPAGGRALVLLDGRAIKHVDFFSRRARQRGVIFSRYVSRRRLHTLTLVALGRADDRSRGRLVEVDALGVLR